MIFMNKRMMNLAIVATLAMPGLLCASKQKQDGITLTVTDYAQKRDSVLGYMPDGALTAEKFLAKGIHPVRMTIKNDTDKSVMISGRSMPRLKCIDQQSLVDIFQKDFTASAVSGAVVRLAMYMGITYLLDMNSAWYAFDMFLVAMYYQSAVGNKHEVLDKIFKDLLAKEELRFPEMIKPGQKISKLILLDERMNKKRMIEFNVFDEKHEAVIIKFEIKLT